MNIMKSFDYMGNGTVVDVLATSESTNGAFAMCVFRVPPAGGPPPHRHTWEDEIFIVLDGTFEIFDGNKWTAMPNARPVAGLRCGVHAFRNSGQMSGSILSITTGSGHDHFLEEASVLRLPQDRAALDEIARRYGIVPCARTDQGDDGAGLLGTDPTPVKSFRVLGEPVDILVSRKQTKGSFTVLTQTSPPQGGAPPHRHRYEDEVFIVIHGEYEILNDGTWTKLPYGDVAHVLCGGVHTFRNCGDTAGKLLAVVIPGSGATDGIEQFLEDLSELAMPDDRERVAATSERYRIEVFHEVAADNRRAASASAPLLGDN